MTERDTVCAACGAPLPDGAMFCGECGRTVNPTASGAAKTGEQCDHCGAMLEPGDIFCGECGNVAGSVSRAFAAGRDTVVIEPIGEPPRRTTSDPSAATGQPPITDDVRSSLSERMRRPHDPGLLEPLRDAAEPSRAITAHGRGQHAARSPGDSSDADHADVEATRIVPARGRGERFVLQFSTGESVTVYGTGLVGRNPIPEPGEYFDHLVRVFDPTRSVSKTHLEFGQDNGAFWVRDRYSGNGTILREPDSRPVRCDPGKRYTMMRGGRIDLGEQFLVVS